MVSVSVYYVAVRTIVLSRHVSNLARPVIIHGLIYVPSTPYCGFLGVLPDGNCAYVHWGVPGGHPSTYEPGARRLTSVIEQISISERRIPYGVMVLCAILLLLSLIQICIGNY